MKQVGISPKLITLFAVMLTSSAYAQAPKIAQKKPDGEPTAAELRRGYLLASKAFRAAAKQVRPSLVMIETFGGVVPGKKKTGRRGVPGIGKPGEGPTTGLIVSADGYVLTSTFNFLTRPPIITVIREDGSRHVARLVGRDDTRKICLLKVEAVKNWPVPKFIADDALRVGQWAITVGLGYGKDPVISAGIISAKFRAGGRAVQTDANISPANYGGPLLDISGKVIGVCVPLNPRSTGAASGVEWYDSGIGFAIPLADAGALIDAMKQGKTIRPALLGVRVKPSDTGNPGVEVIDVLSKSAAETAGIKKGDRILSMDGKTVTSPTVLRFRIRRYFGGQSAKVVIGRGAQTETVNVTFKEGQLAPSKAKKPTAPKSRPMPKK